MTTKIRIKVGGIEVDYEGTEDFLDEKLHKLISDVSALAKEAPIESGISNGNSNDRSGTPSTLASFLKQKKADSNQNMRFLATAVWLNLKKQVKNLNVGDVTKALRDNQQKRLGNPSECLNQNVRKGYCEKTGREFFVTEEGREALR